MSLDLLGPLDDGSCDVLKRFEQTLGRGAVGVALRIAGLQAGQSGACCRHRTAADTCQPHQHPQRDGHQTPEACGMVIALHIHGRERQRASFEPPTAALHLLCTARGQHRLRT